MTTLFSFGFLQTDSVKKHGILVSIFVYLSFATMIIIGYISDLLMKFGIITYYEEKGDIGSEGFPPLFKDFENFYTRNVYRRLSKSFGNPIVGPADTYIDIMERISNTNCFSFEFTGKLKNCINIGSYNYLGYGKPSEASSEFVLNSIQDCCSFVVSSRGEYGETSNLVELETLLSKFLKKEACICFGMGFATNSCNIPAFLNEESLILSDKLNHASIVVGARLSGAKIQVYPHDDMPVLENMIKNAIINGQERTFRPWKNIIILCEGIYSMDGYIVDLPSLIALKKKYKVYLFVDEAHSIGALGENGGGVVEHYGCNYDDIDLLMGTFSKSFAASGGYIAGSKKLIDYIRTNSFACLYGSAMSPLVVAQCLYTLKEIMGLNGSSDGKERIKRLRENSIYFRNELIKRRFNVIGDDCSPVVPLVFSLPGIMKEFAEEMFKFNIAVVIVGFPATSLSENRCRFCISAGHTKESLDYIIKKCDEFGDKYKLKYF